ncbi:MAG: serine hydrolase [Leptospirales bacterium]|jgi:CubicO group peptidase (beta-lactamase class C family)
MNASKNLRTGVPKRRRRIALFAVIAAFAVFACCVWFGYVERKVTLLDPDRITENFRAMDQVFPSRPIRRSSRPLPIPTAPGARAAFDADYEFDGEARRLSDYLKRSHSTGLLVIKRGRVVYEWYSANRAAQDRVTSFSVAKSFVGTLVGAMLAQKKIQSIEDPIDTYLPEAADSGFRDVSIRDVLRMSSGVRFTEDYADKRSDAFTIYDRMFLYMQPIETITMSFPSHFPAGERFEYASINSQILGQLVSRAGGAPLNEILERELWEPLGMESQAYWLSDNYGTVTAFYGLNATMRDFAKLGLLYLNAGRAGGRQILPAAWIRASTQPAGNFAERGRIDKHWGYGLHWWLPAGDESDFAALGVYGQSIYVNPKYETVIVRNAADLDFKRHEFEQIALLRRLARIL